MRRIIFGILISLPVTLLAQQKSNDVFQQKIFLLKGFLDKNHYQPRQWNDSASAMLFDKWLDELDDEKIFFTQKDLAALNIYRNTLDDELSGKGWDFFRVSTGLYHDRLLQADTSFQKFLDKPIDISKTDNITWPYITFAATEQELVLRRQRFLKWQVLDNIADKLTAKGDTLTTKQPADFAKMEAAERLRSKKREGNYIKSLLQSPQEFSSRMQDEYLNTIAWCYDPHTTYMNLREKEEFNAEVSAKEFSSGFSFDENEKGDKTVDYLQPGGSAWRSGQLHKGDVLLKVKKDNVEKDVADISSEELNNVLTGSGSADVEVSVRTTAGEIKTVKLVQEKVSDEENIVKSYIIKGAKNIGYIDLPGFYSREEEGEKEPKYDGCANDVSKEIIKLNKDKISGLILDLRNNGGGSMWEAMQLAGIFIDAGPVASIKERDGKIMMLKDPNRGTIYDGPMIILINGASASASEFFAATMQDYNRALIVGGATYGKGTAQVVLPLDTNKADAGKHYEDFVKVTERKFYRVNGSTVQWKGVEPDITLPDIYSDISFKEKNNVSALTPDLSRAGMFRPLPVLPVADLIAKSDVRTKSAPYFNMIVQFSQTVADYKKGITVPLQWSGFVKYYRETAERFAAMRKERKEENDKLDADNNSFDKGRISVSAKQSKDVNDAYLKNISSSKEITEACKILNDWGEK